MVERRGDVDIQLPERGLSSLVIAPPRRMIELREGLAEIISRLGPQAVEVVRPADLVHLTFSFENMHFESAGSAQHPPVLARRTANRPAFLIVDCHAQHLAEAALYEVDARLPVKGPPAPSSLPPGTDPPTDPDAGNTEGYDLSSALGLQSLPVPPLWANLGGSSRLVFRVKSEQILYSEEGLLAAMSVLDLSVAPQALPPAKRRVRPRWVGVFDSDLVDIGPLLAVAHAPTFRSARSRSRVESPAGPISVASELVALGRMQAAAKTLEFRFGLDAALSAVSGATVGRKLGIDEAIRDIDVVRPILSVPPLPQPAAPTQTSIELPWRLQLSPNASGAFAHSPSAVEHNGRFELWHTRLGVRKVDENGKPVLDADDNKQVDELTPDLRTVRALWARDFDILPAFRFESGAFPNANGSDDRPKLEPFRTALNSRDRMMLVHETSNFHLRRTPRQGQASEPWPPEAIPANRLMLTALGGWLDSRVLFETLPDGGLTIEEWKHRATLGRDHEVKVVYAGFLMPFGHKASLVKITERKFASGPAGPVAYLFQRMFIVVREHEKHFGGTGFVLPDQRQVDLLMPLGSVQILTNLTPSLDPPDQLANGGMLFMPRVSNVNFLFKIVATDIEHHILEFEAPLVFMERDHNDLGSLDGALTIYNTNTKVDRTFDLGGQKVAYAASTTPDDTTLSTASLTFAVVTSADISSVPQDEPRFLPVLESAQAVVPAVSAMTGTASAKTVTFQEHYGKHGFVDNAVEAFLALPSPAGLDFSDKGDRSGGFVMPSMNVSALSRTTGPLAGDVAGAVANAPNFNPGQIFAGAKARLFGLIALPELLRAVGLDLAKMPKFVTQTLDTASMLKVNAERVRNAALDLQGQPGALGTAAATLKPALDTLFAELAALASAPASVTAATLQADLTTIATALGPFVDAIDQAPNEVLDRASREQLAGIGRRVQDQLQNDAERVAASQALVAFAQGFKLPEVVTARLDWSANLESWPASGDPDGNAIFLPQGPNHTSQLKLAVEIQAPTVPGKQPSALISCSISPFDLQLIAPVKFLKLRFKVLEFSIAPGKKPDVNVEFVDPDGIVFDGPLSFVNELKKIIPFDGFSDPPYLDVAPEGIKAGFDLAIPDLAVGVFALTNIALGASFIVPFIDESIEARFNFCTREDPFRLSVSLFAGGGFFAVTITPQDLRILEAAFEFGAAIEVNLGVASGGVSVMAGIYFKLETVSGETAATLTGYFRLRGEVDVLGLISCSIELYLELSYETQTGKAVGRATITIEVEVCFFSFSVSVSAEKKFAGSAADPSFVQVMGVSPAALPGAVRPWNVYCHAFADE